MSENKNLKNVILWLISQEIIESQEILAERLGYNPSSLSQIVSGIKPLSGKFIKKLIAFCDRINPDYFYGKGEMLKPAGNFRQKIGSIKNSHGVIGNINGGNIDIHHDEGKDRLIDQQEHRIYHMFEAFMEELRGFHGYIQRQDDYIKKQDDHLDSIVKKSYLRNERNMERIDKDRERLDRLIDQQNQLIQIIDRQNQKVQEIAGLMFDILGKYKIEKT